MRTIPPAKFLQLPLFRVQTGTRRVRSEAAGFSLVETVLAIGIVAFGLVSLLGLMPVGLSTFRSAMDASISSEIVQHVVSDLRQTDGATGETRYLYFDAQAERLNDAQGALYFVNVVPPPGNRTEVPGGETASLRKVLVEIVKNPRGLALQRDAAGRVVKNPETTIWSHPIFLSTVNG
jgi:uncharacterized protein (TIGR02598 family)